MKYAIGDILLA